MIKIGRSYSGIDSVIENSKENGYKVFECYSKDESSTNIQEEREESVVNCLNNLITVNHIDALYLTHQGGVNNKTVKQIVEITRRNKIFTFSQSEEEVQSGILFGISENLSYVGEFEAENLIRIKNGEKITDLKQLFRIPVQLSFNQKTAKIIDYNPSFLVKSLIDNVYNQ